MKKTCLIFLIAMINSACVARGRDIREVSDTQQPKSKDIILYNSCDQEYGQLFVHQSRHQQGQNSYDYIGYPPRSYDSGYTSSKCRYAHLHFCLDAQCSHTEYHYGFIKDTGSDDSLPKLDVSGCALSAIETSQRIETSSKNIELVVGYSREAFKSLECPDNLYCKIKDSSNKIKGGEYLVQLLDVPDGEEPKPVGKITYYEPTRYRILVIASANELTLTDIKKWDDGWGDKPDDHRISRNIEWFEIKQGKVLDTPREVFRFADLSQYAKKTSTESGAYEDDILVQIADFFSAPMGKNRLGMTQYLIILKSNWQVSSKGTAMLSKVLTDFKGEQADMFTTKFSTNDYTFLEGLETESAKFRHFKSGSFSQIDNQGSRLNGKIRNFKLAPISAQSPGRQDFIIYPDQRPFTLKYIFPSDVQQHALMDMTKFMLCIGKSEGIKNKLDFFVDGVFKSGYMSFASDTSLKSVFNQWFPGFQLLSVKLRTKTFESVFSNFSDYQNDLEELLKRISPTGKEQMHGDFHP